MKKLILALLMLLMMVSTGWAEETSVFVSITNGAGELVMAYEEVVVTDCDSDGVLTIHDALTCAHAESYEGTDGYIAEKTEYGMSLVCLWGEDNGGSFGYYLNHASAWSLLDAVQAGDHVKVYAFTDLEMWSDVYCFFNLDAIAATAGEEISLTLSASGYDAAWNPVTLPVTGAVLTVNGEESDSMTDENGEAMLALNDEGTYVISAVSEAQVLVAPVCIVTVASESK